MKQKQSIFSNVEAPEDFSISKLVERFCEDPHPDKIDLLYGAYRDEDGKPYVLPVVRKIEKAMAADHTSNHEYLPIGGLEDFINSSIELALGSNSKSLKEQRVCGIQTVAGTGALNLCFQFLSQHYPAKAIYVSNPTWGNHTTIIQHVGFHEVKTYRYLLSTTLDIEGMLEDLEEMPEKSVLLLQACSHNPTGVDPTTEEWIKICDIVERKNILTIFDLAYQGFVTGDVEKDSWPVRLFDSRGLEMLIIQSFAKTIGLYNDRIGCLIAVCKHKEASMNILSNLIKIARRNYSNPPNHGARIVAAILKDKELKSEWLIQLNGMVERILRVRQLFYDKLMEINTPGNWEHIIKHKGMFSFTGLNPNQVALLRDKYHIHSIGNSRINIASINHKNVEYIAQSIKDILLNNN